MVDAEPQEIITFDNLNAKVDAQFILRSRPTKKASKAAIQRE